ncbi:AAA family ATPase [Candidatus Dojkabacteria bacterium]|nr:AAA family ATPase [Candidatus Dojkabacteria bacterium]
MKNPVEKADFNKYRLYKKRNLIPLAKRIPAQNTEKQNIQEEEKKYSEVYDKIKDDYKKWEKFLKKQYDLMQMFNREIDLTSKPDDKASARSQYRKSVTNLEQTTKRINNISNISTSPYFGKIKFKFSENTPLHNYKNKELVFYIGKQGLQLQKTKITDWRAPISTIYYNFPKPQSNCFYKTQGNVVSGDLKQKRKIDIEHSQLIEVFEGEDLPSLVGSDPFLLKQLTKSASTRLKDIISTIQAEQNEIISHEIDKDIIIQGVAGSGKTSIAVHRLSWLLYNYKEIDPKKCLIIAPSKLFLKYIAEILPEIGSEDVPQTTFEDWALSKLKPSLKDEQINLDKKDPEAKRKSQIKYLSGLEKFVRNLKKDNTKVSTGNLVKIYKKYAKTKELSKFDLSALIYMKVLSLGIAPAEKIDYLVVDEAQDHSPAEVFILKKFTDIGRNLFVGDIMQGIINHYGFESWEELIKEVFNENETDFYKIKVSYRSTKNIIEFINKILIKKGISANKLPRPVLRTGKDPLVFEEDTESVFNKIIEILKKQKDDIGENVAVIVPEKYVELFYDEISQKIKKLSQVKTFDDNYNGGIVVGHAKVFKGIEFDSVIYVNSNISEEKLALKEFYVACTRAMHNLYLINI